jgi:hypothetical protein
MSVFGESDGEKVSRAILVVGEQIADALQAIAAALTPPKADRITLFATLSISIGGTRMSNPIPSAVVGQIYKLSVVESNATTPSIPPVGPVVFASDNPAVIAVSTDASGSEIATVIAPGTATVSALDQGNGLTDSILFTASAPPPPPPPVATTLTLDATLS